MPQADHCLDVQAPFNQTNQDKTDPAFNAWFVKKFCTMNGSVNNIMLYFPYILLIMAMLLVFIERLFLKVFKAGSKLDKFYSLLVREHLLEGKTSEGDVTVDTVDGNQRDAVEVRQSFKGSYSYFLSYVLRFVTILNVTILVPRYVYRDDHILAMSTQPLGIPRYLSLWLVKPVLGHVLRHVLNPNGQFQKFKDIANMCFSDEKPLLKVKTKNTPVSNYLITE